MFNNSIEVENLGKKLNTFTLDDVSFTLPSGFIMGLVGQNGAGKTTTIRLLMDMIKRDKGEINILGKNLDHNLLDIKQDVAVVFDDTFFVGNWKISDVESAISSFYKNWDSSIYNEFLDSFKISKKKKVKELSRGMKMKLMLSVALSHKAKLLILDEPTSGLDPVARDELLDILLKYIGDEKNSILFSTHITTDLEKIADYITILNNGKVFFTGSKEELIEQYCIVKGALNDLTEDFKANVINIKKYSSGFSALLNVKNIRFLTANMITEKVSIDDILIYINKNDK